MPLEISEDKWNMVYSKVKGGVVICVYWEKFPLCRSFLRAMEKTEERFTNLTFYKMNKAKCEKFCQEHKINCFPTTLLFKNGIVDITLIGSNPGKLDENCQIISFKIGNEELMEIKFTEALPI